MKKNHARQLILRNIHAMAWKNSYKEFNNETKFPAARKFSSPTSHNFSNGPSLRRLSFARFATGRKHKKFQACALRSRKKIELDFGQVYLISCKTGLNVGCKTLSIAYWSRFATMFRLRRRLRFQQSFWRVKPATILRIILSFLKFLYFLKRRFGGVHRSLKKSTCGQVYISFLLRHFVPRALFPPPKPRKSALGTRLIL